MVVAIAGAHGKIARRLGSGTERKLTMDRNGAIKLLNAASAAGVPRFVIVSSVARGDPLSEP